MNNFEYFQSVTFPYVLLERRNQLGLSDELFIEVLYLLSFNQQYISFTALMKRRSIARPRLAQLSTLKIIELKEINEEIHVDLLPLYNSLFAGNIKKETKEVLNSAQIDRIVFILGRKLKSFEIEKINEWLTQSYSVAQIELAVQKSVVNNVDNFKYIETVLKNEEQRSEQKVNVRKNIELF